VPPPPALLFLSHTTLAPRGGLKDSPPIPTEIVASRKMVASSYKHLATDAHQKFVKNMDSIPIVTLPAEETCRSALKLVERGLIGHFTSLWPSPKVLDTWVQGN
jgi:hypothetical protein